MAGGEGTRLRPMTANQPKPLLPVANRPIMEHVLRLLKRHGFDETVVTVQFLAALVRNYFGDGEEFGMSLQYATEEMPLGTAGSVRNAEDALRDEPFLVISGDALTDFDLSDLIKFHKDRQALVTVALARILGWAFATWGTVLYWWAAMLYLSQVKSLIGDTATSLGDNARP